MSEEHHQGERTVLNARDDLRELAERYETVAALDPRAVETVDGIRVAPGSRVPPGAQEVLDADEIGRAITALDEWAEFVAHVIADECDVRMPDLTPARLRTVAEHVAHIVHHPDEFLAVATLDEIGDHLRVMRRLSKRGERRVRTGVRCPEFGCSGWLVSPLGASEDRTEDALACSRCGQKVPFSVWSKWPKARVTYITIEHAARIAGTTIAGVKMRASRGQWRRIGTGRDVRYHVDDVREAAGVSSA